MIVEFDDAVLELVPGNFIVIWFSVEKLFEIANVQSSFPFIRLSGRRFRRCHDRILIEG